jgi:SPP1 gp7 family putative phage head morphogenesis protein
MPQVVKPKKFRELVRARKKRLKGAKVRLKLPRISPPAGIERRYYRGLLAMINAAQGLVEKILFPKLPGIVAQANKLKPTLDAYDDEIRKLVSLIRTNFFGKYTEDDFAELASQIAEAVNTENGRALNAVYRSVIGMNVFISEPWLATELRVFATSNVALIKTLPEKMFSDIENMVFDGVRKGIRHEEIAKLIRDKPFNATKNQAALIARDQVSKLNGNLSELRQKQAGISRYVWRTVGDDRVRDSHAELEGEIFSWDDPPSVGHPGYDYQCRCYAEPYIEDLLGEESA